MSISNQLSDGFSPIMNETHCLIDDPFFQCSEKRKMSSLLNKLKNLKTWYGPNHPSMPQLLLLIGDILGESNGPEISILFFLEQLRIEKYYLGFQHHDLAVTLNRIGEMHLKMNMLLEADRYFSESLSILNANNTKGRMYALTLYNKGLVRYHNNSFVDAFDTFKVALKEQRNVLGEFHLDVADMCIKVGDFQLELGKLDEAMEQI